MSCKYSLGSFRELLLGRLKGHLKNYRLQTFHAIRRDLQGALRIARNKVQRCVNRMLFESIFYIIALIFLYYRAIHQNVASFLTPFYRLKH